MKNENMGGIKGRALVYLISLILGFAVTFIMMLLFAVISVGADLAEGFATPFVSVSAAAGGLVAAFVASKKIGSMGMINGLITGGAMFLIITAIALFLDDGGLTITTLFHFIILMLSSLIGGVWGVNSRSKKII